MASCIGRIMEGGHKSSACCMRNLSNISAQVCSDVLMSIVATWPELGISHLEIRAMRHILAREKLKMELASEFKLQTPSPIAWHILMDTNIHTMLQLRLILYILSSFHYKNSYCLNMKWGSITLSIKYILHSRITNWR